MGCYLLRSNMPQSDQVGVPVDRGIPVELVIYAGRALEAPLVSKRTQYVVALADVGGEATEFAKPGMLLEWKLGLVQATANIRRRWETPILEDMASQSDRGVEVAMSGYHV